MDVPATLLLRSMIKTIDVKFEFTLYLVVTYCESDPSHATLSGNSIYVVALDKWSVNFFADTVNGVPTIKVPQGVDPGEWKPSNENPGTTAPPLANDDSINWRSIGPY